MTKNLRHSTFGTQYHIARFEKNPDERKFSGKISMVQIEMLKFQLEILVKIKIAMWRNTVSGHAMCSD